MQKDSQNPSSSLSNLENLVKLTPILTAVILAVSITFDSAYLWAFGLSLFDIPSSIAEHIRSALLWLPLFLGFLIFGGFEHVISINKNKSSKPANSDKFLMYKFYGAIAITVLILTIISIQEKTFQFVFIIFMLIWMIAIVKLIISYEKNSKRPSLLLRIFYILPIILSGFGYAGYFIGNKTFNNQKTQWEYIIKNENKEISIKIRGQRRFTDFTIAVTEDKKIIIIPNNNIFSMKTL